MNRADLIRCRLASQLLAAPSSLGVEDVVTRLGAVQAQDYRSALWAIGCRLAGSTESVLAQAVAERAIVRTWPMRGTLHFVPARDVRWMLELLAPRVIAGTATRVRQLNLSDAVFAKARKLFIREFADGGRRTRAQLLEALEKAGIKTGGGPGYHILFRLSMEGLVCFGPRDGSEPTFVLLDEWVPETVRLDRAAALAELARRYFGGHGPATLQDFVWWSGLTVADARVALAGAENELEKGEVEGVTHWFSPVVMASAPAKLDRDHLLPAFDEFLLGYRDRSSVLDPDHAPRVVPGSNGVFLPVFLHRGRVAGVWKSTVAKKRAAVTLQPFTPLPQTARKTLSTAAAGYGAYLELPAALDGVG